jgi:hypothetical protein
MMDANYSQMIQEKQTNKYVCIHMYSEHMNPNDKVKNC